MGFGEREAEMELSQWCMVELEKVALSWKSESLSCFAPKCKGLGEQKAGGGRDSTSWPSFIATPDQQETLSQNKTEPKNFYNKVGS